MLYPASVSVLGWGSEGWRCGGGQRNGKFGKFSHSGRVTGSYVLMMICYVCVHVNLAPLTFVGAWSMA